MSGWTATTTHDVWTFTGPNGEHIEAMWRNVEHPTLTRDAIVNALNQRDRRRALIEGGPR